MLLERHEGNSSRSESRSGIYATQREASGILEFSPRKDWKAAHVVTDLYGILHRKSLHWINAAVLTAEEVMGLIPNECGYLIIHFTDFPRQYLKVPERSVEAIKDVKRYAIVDPEYAE